MSSQLHIAIAEEGDSPKVNVIYLKGAVDAATHKDVETKANELINNGASNILIDLAEVDYMGSAGLRALNSIAKTLSASNGHLKLSNPSESVNKVLKTLGFDRFFDIHDTVNHAISSFN